jgi:hypothetical protein
MHMALAERLLADPVLPHPVRDLLAENWGAFLLGSIAPDVRVSSGLNRVSTHFFEYVPQVDPPAVSAMLTQYSELLRTHITDNTRIAFVAGYAAHLAMDQIWCTDLLFPAFFYSDWADNSTKMLVLHVLLSYMDQRDRQLLPDSQYAQLSTAAPNHWLPFIDDEALIVWRDTIASQIAPGAMSLTLDILGKRVSKTAAELATVVDDPIKMAELTWKNIPPEKLAEVEQTMYNACRDAVITYLSDETS